MHTSIKKEIDKTISDLMQKAESGDVDAMFHLFVLFNADAMGFFDESIFNKAEMYLKLSAKGGHSEALEALAEQGVRRYAFEGRCRRNAKT